MTNEVRCREMSAKKQHLLQWRQCTAVLQISLESKPSRLTNDNHLVCSKVYEAGVEYDIVIRVRRAL